MSLKVSKLIENRSIMETTANRVCSSTCNANCVDSRGCRPSQIQIISGTPAQSAMLISWMGDVKCISVVKWLGVLSNLQVTTARAGKRYAITTDRYGTCISAFKNHARLDGLDPYTSNWCRCGGGEEDFPESDNEVAFGSWTRI